MVSKEGHVDSFEKVQQYTVLSFVNKPLSDDSEVKHSFETPVMLEIWGMWSTPSLP